MRAQEVNIGDLQQLNRDRAWTEKANMLGDAKALYFVFETSDRRNELVMALSDKISDRDQNELILCQAKLVAFVLFVEWLPKWLQPHCSELSARCDAAGPPPYANCPYCSHRAVKGIPRRTTLCGFLTIIQTTAVALSSAAPIDQILQERPAQLPQDNPSVLPSLACLSLHAHVLSAIVAFWE